MSLWDYKIFDLIVREGNLRKAAEAMHLTPAAVSHSLAKLEKEFGLPLLVRGRGGMELTQYGRALLPHIRSTLSADGRLHSELQRIKGSMNGMVRIGVINSVCCTWLPSILQRMRESMPDVGINVCQGGYDELESGLIDGSLDLAFVSLPTRKRLSSVPLLHDRLLCITPRSFELHYRGGDKALRAHHPRPGLGLRRHRLYGQQRPRRRDRAQRAGGQLHHRPG